jgi:hypothetical protein
VISKPTTPQLIDAACAELTAKVAPAIADPSTRIVLDMAVAVLQGAARRSANELAWMREEADAIEQLAAEFAAELPDAAALAEGLAAYRDARTASLYLAEAQADYERASELLSRVAEAAYASGDPARKAAVRALYDQRMANEKAVIGVFLAAGRE